jgi:hypothetical protein
MIEQWWCGNCGTLIGLDIHGRCSICGSDAVDRIDRSGFWSNATTTRSTILTERSAIPGQDRRKTFAAAAGISGTRTK